MLMVKASAQPVRWSISVNMYKCPRSELVNEHIKPYSPGLLDNNPEQIRTKLKISAYVLETT